MKKTVFALALLMMVALLVGCGSETSEPAPEPEPLSVVVEEQEAPAEEPGVTEEVAIESFKFVTDEMTVKAGTTVMWTNRDSAPHTVAFDDGSFESDTLRSGDSTTFTFDEPGTYEYHCSIHPSMKGTITVV